MLNPNELNDLVVRRLKECIEDSGMSYGEISKLSGVSKSSVHRYANGMTQKIPIDVIEDIAKAINASAAYIMGWTNDKKEKAPAVAEAKEEEIIRMYSRLTPQNQAVLDTLLESMLEQQDKNG